MNHEVLLTKYIKHVLQCEGTSFTPLDTGDRIRYFSPEFTEDEIEELQRLEKSIDWDEDAKSI
jgi:hypothetical protein